MSVPIDRELLTQAVIVLGVCFGAWMALVQPRAGRMARLEADLERSARETAVLRDAPIEPVAGRVAELRQRCETIADRSRLSRDTARLVSVVVGLAAEERVELSSLQPRLETPDPHRAATDLTRVDLTVQGEYERLASFLGRLDAAGAWLRTLSVQIVPGSRPGTASMQVTCQALGFALPDAVSLVRAGAPR